MFLDHLRKMYLGRFRRSFGVNDGAPLLRLAARGRYSHSPRLQAVWQALKKLGVASSQDELFQYLKGPLEVLGNGIVAIFQGYFLTLLSAAGQRTQRRRAGGPARAGVARSGGLQGLVAPAQSV